VIAQIAFQPKFDMINLGEENAQKHVSPCPGFGNQDETKDRNSLFNSMGALSKRWIIFIRYILILLAILLLLYYYWETHEGFREIVHFFSSEKRINTFVASFGIYAPLAFIALQILQVVIAPIPGEITGIIGGYLFGILPGFFYSSVGLSLGSLLAFLISRRLGLPFVRRFVGQETMAKFDYLMEHQGAFFSFIFFVIPSLPKDTFCYLLGLSPMHVLTFFIISTVGRMPGTLLLTLQGQAIQSEQYRLFFLVLGLVSCFTILTIIYRDRIDRWLRSRPFR
jgi:uncharacterized membrane protein YdjX (TVP38/TMEM64 family)